MEYAAEEDRYSKGKDPLESHDLTYAFEINDFMSKEGPIKMPLQSLYGYDWQIILYPWGTDDYETDLVGVKVTNVSGVPCKASYTIVLHTQVRGTEDLVWDDPDGIVNFAKSGPDATYGCEDLIERGDLKDSEYCVNGVCKFTITIRVFSRVDLMKTPLAMAIHSSGTQSDLIDIADEDIKQVVIPLVGPRAGQIENLQDTLVGSRF